MESRIVESILSHSKETKSLIGIRKYNDDDDFYVGYIIDYNETLLSFQHITKYGAKDGILVEKIENIESIETGDDYIKAYQFLILNPDKIPQQTLENINLPNTDNWQYEILKSLHEESRIVTIELSSDTLVHGYIIDIDEDNLQINPIGNSGKDEGVSIYKLLDIAAISAEQLESRKRQAFFNWRNQNQINSKT
jgi:hypothetical protein